MWVLKRVARNPRGHRMFGVGNRGLRRKTSSRFELLLLGRTGEPALQCDACNPTEVGKVFGKATGHWSFLLDRCSMAVGSKEQTTEKSDLLIEVVKLAKANGAKGEMV